MERQRILHLLHDAIERLADAVADQPPLASSLRRLADRLPDVVQRRLWRPPPRDPSAIQPLLWSALDEGLLDARGFDVAMVTRARAARFLRVRYSLPPPTGSPSASLSSSTGSCSGGG